MKKLKLLRCPKTKRSRYALRKKKNFRGFRVSELENLGNMSLPLNFDSSYKSRFKYTKIWTEWKTERFQYDLKEKIQISEVSEFLILLYTQNRKLGNLGKFYFTSTFSSSIWNPRSKHQKKTWHKIYNFWCGLIREILKFPSFPNFPFGPMNRIEISEISESFRLL